MLKVLVAPLDWGLGHATRCIPIIKELINQDCTVIIAANGVQKILLQEEFPTVRFVEIPGYRIKYGKNRAFTILRLMASIPKILICVKQENQWFSRFARQEQPDVVLSDNRYGLYRKGIVCVFITHQLAIRTPFGTVATIGYCSGSFIPRSGIFPAAGFPIYPAPIPSPGNYLIRGKCRLFRPVISGGYRGLAQWRRRSRTLTMICWCCCPGRSHSGRSWKKRSWNKLQRSMAKWF